MKWDMKIKASAPDTLDITLYGDIEGDGYDWWTGKEIKSTTSADAFKNQIENFRGNTVNIYINSFGGSVFEGNAIVNIIKRCAAKTVAHVDAFACSAASAIACACDETVMPRNAVMMIHNPYTYAVGNAKELRKVADDMDVLSDAYRQVYLEKAGEKLTEAKLIELLDGETYLTAKQAYEFGLCDKVEEYNAELKEPTEAEAKAYTAQGINLTRVAALMKENRLEAKEPEASKGKEAETLPKENTEKPEETPTVDVEALIRKFL